MDRHSDSVESEDLLQLFHRKKTELSCMKNPLTFLRQLIDHNLIPKDRFTKVSRMKSKESVRRGVYEALEWLERERAEHIRLFWSCVLEDVIVSQYPTLRLLRASIVDGSFRETVHLFEKVEKKKMNENKRKEVSDEDDDMQLDSVKKKKKLRNVRLINDDDDDEQQRLSPRQNSKKEEKRNLRSGRVFGGDDDEQPGPSSRTSPARNGSSSSNMKKGEKTNVTVTCGDLQGSLSKGKLVRGQRCICFNKRWFTPTEFERRAGKQSSKNWKTSIRCEGVPLGKLIQDGRLASASFKRGHEAKESSCPPETASDGDDNEDGNKSEESDDEEDQTSSNSEEGSTLVTDEEETEQQEDDGDSRRMTVSCGAATATLHTKRFASGGRGKSVRTETSWVTPEEFAKQASGQTDACWRKDVVCDGKALGLLLKEKTLKSHSLLCGCRLCVPDEEDQENQRNDDDCWVCGSGKGADLVVCDFCPRSFHQTCHLPPVDDAALRDDGPWKCTFCELASRGAGPGLDLQAARSQLVSGHMLKCQYLLLCLFAGDAERSPDALHWFVDISKKLQETDFQTVGEFVSEVQLRLNQADAELPGQRGSLQELFQREFKKVFKIRD